MRVGRWLKSAPEKDEKCDEHNKKRALIVCIFNKNPPTKMTCCVCAAVCTHFWCSPCVFPVVFLFRSPNFTHTLSLSFSFPFHRSKEEEKYEPTRPMLSLYLCIPSTHRQLWKVSFSKYFECVIGILAAEAFDSVWFTGNSLTQNDLQCHFDANDGNERLQLVLQLFRKSARQTIAANIFGSTKKCIPSNPAKWQRKQRAISVLEIDNGLLIMVFAKW